MYERILRLRRPKRKTSALLLPVVALLFGLTTLAAGPEPPLEDCFGGALSFEPLHCYVLEQAHDEGVIGIEAIYDTGTSLYVFVKQKDAMSDETGEFLRRKVEEYHDNWPEHLPHGPMYEECERARGSYKHCLVDEWDWSADIDLYLPWPLEHTSVRLLSGGADERRTFGGWASWEQLWPTVKDKRSTDGAGSGGFDISDVDLTPTRVEDVNCLRPPASSSSEFCSLWTLYPESGLLAWEYDFDAHKMYFQIKSPPKDKAELEALYKKVLPNYDRWREQPDAGYFKYEVVIVPVKYDYGELWQWAELLDRFGGSAGNTVGIIGAAIRDNRTGGLVEGVWPRDDLRDTVEVSEMRETITLSTQDPERVAEALPILLPQLGIPTDAVGHVYRTISDEHNTSVGVTEPARDVYAGGEPTGSNAATETDSGTAGVQTWIIAGGAGVIALTILGVVLLTVWRRLHST